MESVQGMKLYRKWQTNQKVDTGKSELELTDHNGCSVLDQQKPRRLDNPRHSVVRFYPWIGATLSLSVAEEEDFNVYTVKSAETTWNNRFWYVQCEIG